MIYVKIETMEKVDLGKVKKLNRILSGKEKPESRHGKKLQKAQIQLTAKDILKDAKEARRLLNIKSP